MEWRVNPREAEKKIRKEHHDIERRDKKSKMIPYEKRST
jgi:hypothetical protein